MQSRQMLVLPWLLKMRKQLFHFIGVNGDGLCLFHSLREHDAIRGVVENGRELRGVARRAALFEAPPHLPAALEVTTATSRRAITFKVQRVHLASATLRAASCCIFASSSSLGCFLARQSGRALQRCAEGTLELVSNHNEKSKKSGPKAVMELIDPSLASICQPRDVATTSVVKCLIRKAHHAKINEHLDDGARAPGGGFVKMSHEGAAGFLESAHNAINKQQEHERALAAELEKCGLSFCASSHQMFESCLESLNEDGAHKALTKSLRSCGLDRRCSSCPCANANHSKWSQHDMRLNHCSRGLAFSRAKIQPLAQAKGEAIAEAETTT